MSKSPRQTIREYFDFSRKDRSALITLLSFILLLTGAHIIIGHIKLCSNDYSREYELAKQKWLNESLCDSTPHRLFQFDPNYITENEMDSLSLPEFIKENLIKYRAAGGKFYRQEDFKKLYGMNDSIYEAIKDSITIREPDSLLPLSVKSSTGDVNKGNKEHQEKELNSTYENNACHLIEINKADSAGLVKLRGIGPVFAARIIKYRNLLGGFHSVSQLLEVYNFPEETYRDIRKYIYTDTLSIKKLRINFAGYKEFLRHPYLDSGDVRNILDYRSNNGPFLSAGKLLESGLLDSADIDRIRPYISCQ
jgi:DNA uptake protein ComE-like DNA-binding protein